MEKLIKYLNKPDLLKYGVAAILLAIPLYPKFPLFSIPGTYVSVRLEDFLLVAVGVIWLLTNLQDVRKILRLRIIRLFGIFMFVGLISVLSGVFITDSVEPHLGLLHWARRLEYFLPFVFGYSVIKKRSDIKFFLNLLPIIIIYAFIYGVGEKYWSWPVITTQNLEFSKGIAQRLVPGSHLNSTFAGHYDLASFMVLILPILLPVMVLTSGIKKRAYFFISFICGLWLLANSLSRISVVSYLLAGVITLVLLRKYLLIPLLITISLLVFATSSDLISRYVRIFMVTMSKIVTVVTPSSVYAQEGEQLLRRKSNEISTTPTPEPVFEDRSTSIRLNVEWPRAIRAFKKNPLIGTGFSSITLATDNDYLRLMGEVGSLGLFAFLLILVRIVASIINQIKLGYKNIEGGYVLAILGSFGGVLLNAFFIDVFEASKFAIIFWLLLGFSVKVSEDIRK